MREVEQRDRAALGSRRVRFQHPPDRWRANRGTGAGNAPDLSAGEQHPRERDSPFLQIGETKYGKPILDRGFNYERSLRDAVKFGIISIDATMKSNVAVGPPIDFFCYEQDSLVAKLRTRLEENDPYLQEIETEMAGRHREARQRHAGA